jgi:hypothetical protein
MSWQQRRRAKEGRRRRRGSGIETGFHSSTAVVNPILEEDATDLLEENGNRLTMEG